MQVPVFENTTTSEPPISLHWDARCCEMDAFPSPVVRDPPPPIPLGGRAGGEAPSPAQPLGGRAGGDLNPKKICFYAGRLALRSFRFAPTRCSDRFRQSSVKNHPTNA